MDVRLSGARPSVRSETKNRKAHAVAAGEGLLKVRWLEMTAIVIAIGALGLVLDSFAPMRVPRPEAAHHVVDFWEVIQTYAKGPLPANDSTKFDEWCANDAMCAGERLRSFDRTSLAR